MSIEKRAGAGAGETCPMSSERWHDSKQSETGTTNFESELPGQSGKTLADAEVIFFVTSRGAASRSAPLVATRHGSRRRDGADVNRPQPCREAWLVVSRSSSGVMK